MQPERMDKQEAEQLRLATEASLRESLWENRAPTRVYRNAQTVPGGHHFNAPAEWPPRPPVQTASRVQTNIATFFGEKVPTVTQPSDFALAKEIFRDFGTQYSLDPRVIKFLITSEGINTLETFRYAYSEEVDFRNSWRQQKPSARREESHTTKYKLPNSTEHGLK